jgi:hypothetical protein
LHEVNLTGQGRVFNQNVGGNAKAMKWDVVECWGIKGEKLNEARTSTYLEPAIFAMWNRRLRKLKDVLRHHPS